VIKEICDPTTPLFCNWGDSGAHYSHLCNVAQYYFCDVSPILLRGVFYQLVNDAQLILLEICVD